MKKIGIGCFVLATVLFAFSSPAKAQDKEKYFLGEELKLTMIVHVWGAVARPGEYIVPDDTNVLELISKAGGPTEFSNLGKIYITRTWQNEYGTRNNTESSNGVLQGNNKTGVMGRVIKVDMQEFLQSEDYEKKRRPQQLMPGDVVMVARNKLYTWRNVISVVRDISVFATIGFLVTRTINN